MSSGSTTRLHIPYPVNSDTANIAADMQAIATYIDTNVIPYYQGSVAPSSPASGEFWWNTTAGSTYGLNYYDGSAWRTITASSDFFSGTAANRSTVVPSPVFGNFYWATDTLVLSFYNGASWIATNSNAGNGIQVSSSTVSLSGTDATLLVTATTTYTLPLPSSYNRVVITLTSGDNLVITGWSAPAEGQWLFVNIIQPSSGSTTNTVSWTGSTFKCPGGVKPTMSTGASAEDWYAVKYTDGAFHLMTMGQAFA